jgi:hypothetical protein
MSMQIDNLRWWSHFLFWCSVLLPLLGVCAGVVRFYVDRKEKELSSTISKATLDQSRKELTELKSQTAPRHLSSEQKSVIMSSLGQSAPAPVTFVSRLMDGEGADFAKDLGDVFQQAGWRVAYNRSSLVDFQGVRFALVGVEPTPPEVDVLLHSLVKAGISVTKQELKQEHVSGEMQAGIAVFIGRR